MKELKGKLGLLEKFKYPILMLIIGILLMLLPGSAGRNEEAMDSDILFEKILESTEGVGEAKVIVSDSGVVIVCQGAENAAVRLDILQAIKSYTGFSTDKITVLKMADQMGGKTE